jgi:RNA polymerase sigma factor (sigma-70 family)
MDTAFAAASRIYPERHFTVTQPEMTLGDVELDTFYRRHKAELVWLVKVTTNVSYEEAEDAVQEAFVRALEQGKPISNPHGWFKVVAIQIVADSHPKSTAHRRHRVRETLTEPSDLPEQPWDRREWTLPAEWVELKEEQRLAAEEIGTLSGKPRKVMAEHYSGTPHEEIAQLLGISLAAVRQNLARARRALRKRAETRQKDAS